MCHLHSLVIWSEGDHTMKGDRPQTEWQKDRKYAMKCAMKGLRSPIYSTKNQETHSLIIEDNNFCDLQHLHHRHWKTSPSLFFFLLELSVKRPHERRTKNISQLETDEKKKKWQENKCHKTSVVTTCATISRLSQKEEERAHITYLTSTVQGHVEWPHLTFLF